MDPLIERTTSIEQWMGRPSDQPADEDNVPCEVEEVFAPSPFENYEGKSDQRGRTLPDWLVAEADFLRPLNIRLSETSDALTIRAELPGYKGRDLKIDLAPGQVTITGKRKLDSKSAGADSSQASTDPLTRVIDLPGRVNVNKVRITAKDGALEVDLERIKENPNVVELKGEK